MNTMLRGPAFTGSAKMKVPNPHQQSFTTSSQLNPLRYSTCRQWRMISHGSWEPAVTRDRDEVLPGLARLASCLSQACYRLGDVFRSSSYDAGI